MKVQQIDTKNFRTWQVDGYLISDSQQIRVKKRGFDSKRSAQQWFNNESVLFENGESKYNKKKLPTL